MRDDFRLNAFTDFNQDDAAIAPLAGGGFVAVWRDAEQDDPGISSTDGVYARVFDAAGRPQGREFRVHQGVAGDQVLPDVAAFEDGGFAVAWSSDGPNARGDADPYLDGWARAFDADGTPRGRQFQITPDRNEDHRIEALATLADGTVVAVTAASQVSTDWEVAAVRFDADGRKVGGRAILVDAIDTGLAGFASTVPGVDVAPDGRGGYAVTWREYPDGEAVRRVYARSFDADGDPEAPTRAVTDRIEGRSRDFPHVAALPGGKFAVAWIGEAKGDRNNDDGYFRILDATGSPLTPERRVNDTDRTETQGPTDVTHLGGGLTLVTYVSYNTRVSAPPFDYFDVKGRIFDGDGQAVSTPFLISMAAYEDGSGAQTVVLGTGELMTVWNSGGSVEKDVWGRVYDLGSSQRGGGGDDVLRGVLLKETLDGRGGDDLIRAGAGDDRLIGGSGDDRLLGERGDDRLLGGDGADVVDGGPGDDVLRGGAGGDRFVFARGGDRDTIADFGDRDRIDLRDFGLSRRELRAALDVRGEDVRIDLGRGDRLTVEDTRLAALDDAFLI